ncbi:MAG TPA: hypothetical protein VFA71_06095 [Terriglobales bacterium]|nr:hypothetical protein [Terriglobales bacterium]
MFDLSKALSRALKSPEHRSAWFVAIAADLIQLVAFPFFGLGGLSPADAVLDVVTGAILLRLLGWHWALLPSFIAELVPGLDLFPTWTAAVLYITTQRGVTIDGQAESKEPQILPPTTNRTPISPR